jgi:hypothetical protein
MSLVGGQFLLTGPCTFDELSKTISCRSFTENGVRGRAIFADIVRANEPVTGFKGKLTSRDEEHGEQLYLYCSAGISRPETESSCLIAKM